MSSYKICDSFVILKLDLREKPGFLKKSWIIYSKTMSCLNFINSFKVFNYSVKITTDNRNLKNCMLL